MDEEQTRSLVRGLDTRDAKRRNAAWLALRPLGEAVVPYLAEFYPKARTLEGRRELVFHAIRFARTSEAAFALGVAGLNDKASIVRYRACAVLAYSLRREAIPYLKKLLSHSDAETAADARAAIDAIEHQVHHYFVDRGHTGRSFWQVGEDGALPGTEQGG